MRHALTLALTLTASAAAGHASAQHADSLLVVDPDGNLVAGQIDFDSTSILNVDTRVYEGEFEGPFGPFDNIWTTDEPGFNALSSGNTGLLPVGYTTLPGETSVTFDANAITLNGNTANLWHWDGLGDTVNFAAVTGPTTLEISKSPTVDFSAILDGSDADITGFEIAETTSSGFLHQHIDFAVTDTSAPDTGFYLWSLTLHAGAGLQTDPLYFVHGLGIEDEVAHEAAIGYVEASLVPEPGSAILLMLGVTGLLARQRPRQTLS